MLRHLHLTEAEIAEGLEVIPEEAYMQTITDVLRQKNRTLHDTDAYQRKVKLIRYLLSRGYEMELAIDAVDALLRAE